MRVMRVVVLCLALIAAFSGHTAAEEAATVGEQAPSDLEQLSQLHESLIDAEKQALAACNQQLQQQQTKTHEAESQSQDLTKQLGALQKQLDTLNRKTSKLESENAALETRVSELRSQLQRGDAECWRPRELLQSALQRVQQAAAEAKAWVEATPAWQSAKALAAEHLGGFYSKQVLPLAKTAQLHATAAGQQASAAYTRTRGEVRQLLKQALHAHPATAPHATENLLEAASYVILGLPVVLLFLLAVKLVAPGAKPARPVRRSKGHPHHPAATPGGAARTPGGKVAKGRATIIREGNDVLQTP